MSPNPLFDLTGRVALVTGATKGLGRAMAMGLAKAGASLALCARDAEALASARAEAEQHGVRAETFRIDVTSPLTAEVLRDPENRRLVAERTPMGRWGQPEELQGIAVFLASRASDYVTGQIVHVDGGWTAW